MSGRLERLEAGMVIPFGGDRTTTVGQELAAEFAPGDHLVVVQSSGDLLRIPATVLAVAHEAVHRADRAFASMAEVGDDALDRFYLSFADRLADDDVFGPIGEANEADIEQARLRGRSVTRLVLDDKMRFDMIDGLRTWAGTRFDPGPVDHAVHDDWQVELRRAGLGVVGFVFEGRPNVFADATGVLRSGNTVVFRIGSDALGTARAILAEALAPALASAGLPDGAISLVDSPERSAGWAMFSDPRLALAVARGSGAAVLQLGAVARQAGTPVSLHGTGGAWMVASAEARAEALAATVYHSLDRKVCNTLNTLAVVRSAADVLVPAALDGLSRAAERRGVSPKLHVVGDIDLPVEWRAEVEILRAGGASVEPMAEPITPEELGREWEWEDSPEMTLLLVDDVEEAVELFNRHSPRFVASLISDDPAEHERFYATIDAPFVGNGFTRWVDGQYALDRPELGLSNWQFGRLFGRGGVLSGDSVYTIRTRATMEHPDIGR